MNIKLQTNEQLSATVANGLAGVFVNGVSLSTSLSEKVDLTALQNYYTTSETSSANQISTALENTGSKVYFDNHISGVTGSDDLSVVKLSADEYAEMLDSGTCLSNVIYIVETSNFDVLKQRIVHLAPAVDLSDAVNLEQLNSIVGANTDLSTANTIYGSKAYASYLVNSLDVTDTPVDGKFVVAVSQENGVISVQKAALTIPEGLSSYIDTKSQLSADGYIVSTQLGSIAYKLSTDYVLTSTTIVGKELSNNITVADISTAVHLSDYALVKNVSSTTELNAKFNTLSTYSQTKQQLSSDGYATQSSIPSYNDISTNIHLSDYALTNSVSSKEDISNKVTALLSTSTDNQYPTAKCMYDIIGNIESALDVINNGGAQ